MKKKQIKTVHRHFPNLGQFVIGAALLFALFALPPAVVNAQAVTKEKESWLGTLDVGAVKLRLQLSLEKGDDGKYSGEMISLDQAQVGILMDRVTRTDKVLAFEIKKISASFEGTLNKDQTVASGVFTQGKKLDIVFKRVADAKPDTHLETWQGTMNAAGKKFEFQFRMFEDGQGETIVKLDSLSESLMNIPADFERKGDKITIEIPMTQATFVGTLSGDGEKIDGDWLQRGGTYPLNLTKIPLEQTRSLDLNRPQTPSEPFDYDVTDFSVDAKTVNDSFSKEVNLAGTMTSPRGDGPFPTVILISGSGPQDRDERIFEHRPFLVLADDLTKKGFAVIRYDDRGIGESKGDFANSTTVDFADDVEVVMGWALTQSKVDPERIILAGHSEGGIIAPLVASRRKDVAGVIMLAGPGVPGSQIVLNQTRKIAAAAGLPENILQMQDSMLKKVLSTVEAGNPITDELKTSLMKEFGDLTPKERTLYGIDDVADKTAASFESTWMKYFLVHDPRPALAQTTCPILSVIGERDLQVDPELNMPEIEKAVAAGKNPDFVQKELPGLNHLFQAAETGSPSEYIQIEETLNPVLLDVVGQWLEERFK